MLRVQGAHHSLLLTGDIDAAAEGRLVRRGLGPVDVVVADVSFISLTMLLDPLLAVVDPQVRALLMVKPQYEVGRKLLGSGGVVRSAELREQAVAGVVAAANMRGWGCFWQSPSRLPGPSGNVEYFIGLARDKA